ncbi:MAG: ABC transporter ATP-binding protein [Methanoregulaceae archaeon]|jgi:NitT/TauT family transport system ATP-binding protein|nr:ABC transporter ATP-binding protein [Methanoregulaceae archaeon]
MTLIVENLSKEFEQRDVHSPALVSINLEVQDKEFTCVLGPSGCGKTTLLRIIAGLEKPTSGKVIIGGEIVTEPTPRLAMIFQDYSLFPWRTVLDNIAFGLEMKGIDETERHRVASHYLDLIGLCGFGKNYPYELSGGMRQRVAVARALAIDPSVLLMDEPFGALDAQTRNMLQKQLLEIWEKTQKTILFVTHSVDEAVFMADRIVVLTSRPGTVKEVVKIDLPRPRDRTSLDFASVRRYVLGLIDEQLPIQ